MDVTDVVDVVFRSWEHCSDYGYTVRRLDYPFRSDRGPQDFL